MEYKLANIVLRLKEVKEKRPELTLQKISDNTGVPYTTVQVIFAEGSEENTFRYESIQPIAKMLLDLDDLGEGNGDDKAYKAIIQFYETSIAQQKEHYEKKIDELRTEHRKRIDFLIEQISRKDERIDWLFKMVQKLDNIIEALNTIINSIKLKE